MAIDYRCNRRMGGYLPGQVVDPSGWRHKKILAQNGWIQPYGGESFTADDGTRWDTADKAARRSGRGPDATPEPERAPDTYEFTEAAEAILLGAGYELEDYAGAASGAAGDVLKRDAEAWLDSL